jgi:hypothetical protein
MASFTTKADEEFFAAIGRLTISWAEIELGLDCAVDIIHRFLGGQEIETEAPRTSLYRKIRYIRKWTRAVPEPTFRNAVPVLLDEIETAAEVRHDLIHGVVLEMTEGTGEAEMVRVLHSKANLPEKKYFKVATVEILRAAVAASKLATRSLKMGTGLQEFIAALPEILKEADDKLGS